MDNKHYIPLPDLCTHYKLEMSFFDGLQTHGLIECITINKTYCIHEHHVSHVEKMVRLYQDLNLNYEGIDTVFNLLDKIESLKFELNSIKNRLRRYEDL